MTCRERPSRVPGATVWWRTADGSDSWILPDGCMDLIWDKSTLFVAGPDTGRIGRLPQPGQSSSGCGSHPARHRPCSAFRPTSSATIGYRSRTCGTERKSPGSSSASTRSTPRTRAGGPRHQAAPDAGAGPPREGGRAADHHRAASCRHCRHRRVVHTPPPPAIAGCIRVRPEGARTDSAVPACARRWLAPAWRSPPLLSKPAMPTRLTLRARCGYSPAARSGHSSPDCTQLHGSAANRSTELPSGS